MFKYKHAATTFVLAFITITSSAFGCGTYLKLETCKNAPDAYEAMLKNNSRIYDYKNKNEINQRLDIYEYDKSSIQISDMKTITTKKKKYVHYTFTMTAANPTFKEDIAASEYNKKELSVNVHYFKSIKKKGKRPLIIGFPTIMKFDKAEPRFAKKMSSNGLSVMVPEVESIVNIKTPLKEIDSNMRRTIIKARMLIDLAETKFSDEIDSSKIATWGLSLGGVYAATLIGVDQRIDAAAIISAGGNNADIFAYSTQEYVQDFRNQKLKELGFNIQQYFDYIRKTSQVDSLFFANRVKPEQVFMVMPSGDFSIPSRNQLELWEAFGRPKQAKKYWVKGKHKGPILKHMIFQSEVLDFLKKKLQ